MEEITEIRVKSYTLLEYLKLVGVSLVDTDIIQDWEDLSSYLNDMTRGNLWAYPIEEFEYVLQENINVVCVELPNGNLALAEIDENLQKEV